jgi:Cu/Ag efflux pump CusA
LQFPGVSNAWTMPIKARIDMLSTGILGGLTRARPPGP